MAGSGLQNDGLGGAYAVRPKLEFENGQFNVHGRKARIVFGERTITVGCSDAEPEALRKLLLAYDQWKSGKTEFVFQS